MTTDDKNQQQNRISSEKNNKNLELTNFIHQDFIKTISISIKTPCTSIWALSTTLYAVEEDDSSKRMSIAHIVACANELMEYSKKIVDFAKGYPSSITNTSIVPLPTISKTFNPRTLVQNVITKLSLISKYKKVKLVSNLHRDVPSIIIGDSFRIEAMLTQLITNAINFTEKGSIFLTSNFFAASPIELQNNKDSIGGEATKCKKSKDILHFIVHDTGIGMSEEKQQYLYEQLNSCNSSTSTASDEKLATSSNLPSESTLELGLGLNLVKQFIYEVNGEIAISSKQGKGTTFTLQVPVTSPSVEDIINDQINNMTSTSKL